MTNENTSVALVFMASIILAILIFAPDRWNDKNSVLYNPHGASFRTIQVSGDQEILTDTSRLLKYDLPISVIIREGGKRYEQQQQQKL